MKSQRVIKFSEKSREELAEEILRLEKENEYLRRKLGSKERADERRKLLKLMRESQKVANPKTLGRKPGHKGVTRVKPSKIDRVVELK
jgi:CRISPR/Cas system-associated protein Csm6